MLYATQILLYRNSAPFIIIQKARYYLHFSGCYPDVSELSALRAGFSIIKLLL
ncbi:hypothetical protein MTBBW1_2130079 [Desulfamplus magnetovallimortis]|uniref:Uncharacterized protein n=1 Tax=Desulfamplus magnetovallimortis TaxID=1246637 RepID=A0A1W1HCG3_9BACT|nr:hypothetical protein MTBBW1_2130079 [Desulfamplus magnetovallimortis]